MPASIPENRLKLCLLASEITPFAKTGGLADVSAALGRFLHGRGHDVRLFLPLYRRVRADYPLTPVEGLQEIGFRFGDRLVGCSVWRAQLPGSDCPVYCIDHREMFDGDSLYTGGRHDALRFLFFCRAVLECCQRMRFGPDIFHCNDWHTAMLPLMLKTDYAWDKLFAHSKTLLSIHNLGYQGMFSADPLLERRLFSRPGLLHGEDLAAGRINFLKTGILYATGLSTVSRTYAREIQTAEFGVGLEGYLRARDKDLYGIVNGVDYDDWDPAHDALLPARYGPDELGGKRVCRDTLLREMGLRPVRGRTPVLGVVTRLTPQKGLNLLFKPLPRFLRSRDMRVVVLGSGAASLEQDFRDLQGMFPGRVCYYQGYNNKLAHWIEAGSDIFLMPSLYEPCGLNQMYSLRYGTVPVVRRTGGLADTVQHFQAGSRQGTGFVFDHFNAQGFAWALGTALEVFQYESLWHRLMLNGMAQDFSWQRQGPLYEKLYKILMTAH